MKNHNKPDILNRYIYKILLIMRLTTVILMISILQVSAATVVQEFNYVKKGVSLIQIFNEIKKQTGYNIIWNEKRIAVTTTIDANFKKATIYNVMEKALSAFPVTFVVNNKNIVIKAKEKSLIGEISVVIKNVFANIDISGRVVDEHGNGLPAASVKVKNSTKSTITDDKGFFTLTNIEKNSILIISYVGYETIEISASEELGFIKLISNESKLKEVEIVSTGYQEIPKERATGSFTVIDNKTLSRRVSSDLLSRLNGVTNGLLFDSKVGNPTGISIRGRNTIFSNTTPLIVVDNFPFEGDLTSLNPEMVETVTFLKDAAAASIWGAYSGNGVIVITTKKGAINQKPNFSFKTDLTIGEKPDLYYQPQLTSSEFIDIEKYLFDQGAYTAKIEDSYSTLSPVVEILQKIKLDPSYTTQGTSELNLLRNIDYRDQQNQFLYRNSVNQRYIGDVKGGTKNNSYYFSVGYDKNLPNYMALSDSRYTVKGNNSYNFLNDKLQLNSDITFSKNKSQDNLNGMGFFGFSPYEQIADQNGNPLSTVFDGGLRSSYTDIAGNGNLLDWKYRPLDELANGYSSYKTDFTDYRLNFGVKFKIVSPLTISINYQFYNLDGKNKRLDTRESFYTRNLINTYSQINTETGIIVRPIPLGDIYSPQFNNTKSNNARGQLDFYKVISQRHVISAIAGYNIMDKKTENNTYTLFGYNQQTATSVTIDPLSQFPNYITGGTSTIGVQPRQSSTINRQVSWYGNASYTYNDKYVFSGSLRKDASNLFGVKANQKGVPLWSTGVAWNIHSEKFWSVDWLSSLQLKATYGYNGNVNNSISAYLTAAPRALNPFSRTQYFQINNPPNDDLRWERVKNFNAGLSFSSRRSRLSGSVEYYVKNGVDLIASSSIAPQTGVSLFTGNTANTHVKGVDLELNSKNLDGVFQWNTSCIFNYVKDKITSYFAASGTNNDIVSTNTIAPIVGYPINSVYGFKWAGLNSTGDPQGYEDGAISIDYSKIRNTSDVNQLQFFGSRTPTIYGGFRNSFAYKGIELSLNISYKMGYYFRRSSLNSSLFSGNFFQSEYNERWQKAGDELVTQVPALSYPGSSGRSIFYEYSGVLVEKGDHVRLQDIQINYTLTKKQIGKVPFSSINFYAYANNVGLLWRANKHGLDPDASVYPNPRTIAFGVLTKF